MNLRNSVAIVLLAAAAGASYWWSREPPAPALGAFDVEAALPAYNLRGARFTWTDELGRVAYRFHTESLEELPDEQGLALVGVRVEYTPADAARWVISAERARAPNDRSRIDFEGDVDVRNQPPDGELPTVVETGSLRLIPAESRVESDQAVAMRVAKWRLQGVGLRANLNDGKLTLESKVHVQVVQ